MRGKFKYPMIKHQSFFLFIYNSYDDTHFISLISYIVVYCITSASLTLEIRLTY